MSSNIYEDPDLNMNVKYSIRAAEDRGQRVERLVDIYQDMDTDQHRSTQVRGAHIEKHLPAVQRNPFRAAALVLVLVLGLLCLLLLAGVIVLFILYISVTQENNKLSIRYEELQTEHHILSRSVCQPQGNITEWRTFQCSCYYKSTEVKNWTESRKDCRTRGADLVMINSKSEHEFISKWKNLSESWIGLQPVKRNGWNWEWEWLDGSSLNYQPWKKDVNIHPMNGTSSAYIDLDGNWNQTKGGSKQWICEKWIYQA